MMALMDSRWARAATSGTTPPNLAWRSICEETMLERTRWPSSTTAAAVSSQVVSMPRMSMGDSIPDRTTNHQDTKKGKDCVLLGDIGDGFGLGLRGRLRLGGGLWWDWRGFRRGRG